MYEFLEPKIESVAADENYARFNIEPLESGFGLTIGNALRRVLLGALPGAAVTAVKIGTVTASFVVGAAGCQTALADQTRMQTRYREHFGELPAAGKPRRT